MVFQRRRMLAGEAWQRRLAGVGLEAKFRLRGWRAGFGGQRRTGGFLGEGNGCRRQPLVTVGEKAERLAESHILLVW